MLHALHRWGGGGLFLGPTLGRVGDPGAQTHNVHNQQTCTEALHIMQMWLRSERCGQEKRKLH